VGRAVARLVCAAGHIVAQSEPDTASEAGLWRWRPETDGLSDVVWALLVDPDNWEGEEKRLIAALDCVKREWGVADAIERLKDREAKRKPKRGRPPKYDDDASRDALMVCSAWDRASDAGIPKQLFCKDRGLEPGKLDSYLRHRRRERAKR
jgi:hypothetical protein